MTFKNEGEFNRWWTACLRQCNSVVLNVVGGGVGQDTGWPDRYVAHTRWHGWLEGKLDIRKKTPNQTRVMQSLLDRGVPAYVIRWDRETCTLSLECDDVVIPIQWRGMADGKVGVAIIDTCIQMEEAHGLATNA